MALCRCEMIRSAASRSAWLMRRDKEEEADEDDDDEEVVEEEGHEKEEEEEEEEGVVVAALVAQAIVRADTLCVLRATTVRNRTTWSTCT